MHINTQLSDELGRYLDLSALRLKLTAQNMANVDVPGYRTVGFDFSEAMEASIADVDRERRPGDHGEKSLLRPKVKNVDGLLERPDGNNVSMDREGMQMAEAQLEFRMGSELIKNEFSTILDAIHVDSK
ncbi:flagellar basal body rod protein FlgB [Silvibacterium acidisoli]|uniref:flagellar basal body rod protein FlgB n=1 Tax=Acidobacteriaceae bacterium ZG23-2 TaxID=2883246 RepID=UPI00406D44CE